MIKAVAEFLKAARSLSKQGIKKDQVMEFAKREFGEVNDLFKRQIEQIFTPKSGGITSIKKPEGKVIEASFKPGMSKSGKTVQQSPSQRAGLAKLMDEGEGIEFSIPSQGIIRQKGTVDEIMNYLSTNPYRKGGPLDPNTGMTRTAARDILKRLLDEGKIKIPDETERDAIAKGYQGGVDPIVVFEKVFGRENLQDLSELADEMNRAGDYTELQKILKREDLYGLKQKDKYELDPGGMTDEELREVLKDKLGKDPDDTGFADGGRVKYAYGSGLKLAKYLAIRGKTLKDEIKKAIDNFIQPSGDIKYDADVVLDDMLEELGTSRGEIDEKDIIDAYGEIYDEMIKPVAASVKNKPEPMTPQLIERYKLKNEYPGIDEDTLTEIIQMDPEKKARMMADMEMGKKLIEEGKGVDEVKDILTREQTRTKQADGGLSYLMGM